MSSGSIVIRSRDRTAGTTGQFTVHLSRPFDRGTYRMRFKCALDVGYIEPLAIQIGGWGIPEHSTLDGDSWRTVLVCPRQFTQAEGFLTVVDPSQSIEIRMILTETNVVPPDITEYIILGDYTVDK